VHWASAVHALAGRLHVPVPAPVQQRNGLPEEMHEMLRGHEACEKAPSKQPVPPPGPPPLTSRQKPQNTRFMLVRFGAVLLTVAVDRAKAIGRPPMSRAAVGGQSWLVGKLGSTGESAGMQELPLLGPPWQTTEPPQVPPLGQSALLLHGPAAFEPPVHVWLQTGHDWMPSAVGKRSPVRKSSELSGRLRLEAPVEQFAVPVPFWDTVLMTHKLIGVVAEFGIGSGGPNRHPVAVQFRLLPVWVELSWLRVRLGPLPTHDTAVSELPMSGTLNGSGTPELPPPV